MYAKEKKKKSSSTVESVLQHADVFGNASFENNETPAHTLPRARLPLLAAPKGTFYYSSYAFYEDHHVGCGAISLIKWRTLISSQTAIPVIRRATATRLSSLERTLFRRERSRAAEKAKCASWTSGRRTRPHTLVVFKKLF